MNAARCASILVFACTMLAALGSERESEVIEEWKDQRRLAAASDHMDDGLFDGSLELWRVMLASGCVLIVTMLAVAAGIGGGGLLLPIYAYILGLGPQLAVPVSKATIFGVAVGNVFFISRERHPKAERPVRATLPALRTSEDPCENVGTGEGWDTTERGS